jgi:carbon-monoxide dehydrogenase medium subunit
MPCIAIVCDARLRVLGPQGERVVAADSFFEGPLSTVLTEDELILEVQLPSWPAGRRWAFVEFSMRPGDFALAGVALYYDLDAYGAIVDAHLATVGRVLLPSSVAERRGSARRRNAGLGPPRNGRSPRERGRR